jgi:acetamidase/formamidase
LFERLFRSSNVIFWSKTFALHNTISCPDCLREQFCRLLGALGIARHPRLSECSVAMNLRLSQVVNEPMFTLSAAIPKRALPARKFF